MNTATYSWNLAPHNQMEMEKEKERDAPVNYTMGGVSKQRLRLGLDKIFRYSTQT